jgi:hypothetical protein
VAIDADGRALAGWSDYKTNTSLTLYHSPYGVMAAQGTAGDGWSAPEPVGIPAERRLPSDVTPSFAAGREGSLSWTVRDGLFSGPSLVRAHRLEDGTWSGSDSLDPPPRPGPPVGRDVWPGPDGTAHGVWRSVPADSVEATTQNWDGEWWLDSRRPVAGTVEAATRNPAGEWSEPDVLDVGWGSTTWIHWDRTGNAHVFLRKDDQSDVFTASWRPGSGWSPVHVLGSMLSTPLIRVTGAGEVIVTWTAATPDARPGRWSAVRSAVRSPGGSWAPSVELDQARVYTYDSDRLVLAVADDGDALLLDPTPEGVMAATRPAGGEWSAMTLALPAFGREWTHLLLNDRGEALGVSIKAMELRGIWCRVDAATRSAAGAWSAPQALGEAACKDLGAGQVQAKLNEAGQALVLFPESEGWTDVVNVMRAASVSIPDGAWSAPTTISLTGRHALAPSLALDEGGDAVAVWEQTDKSQPFTLATTAAVYGARWTVTADPPPAPAPSDPENLPGPQPPVAEPTPTDAPAILSAFAAVRPEGQLKRAKALRPGGRTFAVRVVARGALKPGTRVQVARSPARPAALHPYARMLMIRGERPLWARLLDAAGRASPWRRIKLDRHRPVVRLASLVSGPAGVRLRIAARDDASGLKGMQLALTRARPGPMLRFRALTAIGAGRAPRWVRVEDGMGRTSAWTAVRSSPKAASTP